MFIFFSGKGRLRSLIAVANTLVDELKAEIRKL